jgi:hypothetical protein
MSQSSTAPAPDVEYFVKSGDVVACRCWIKILALLRWCKCHTFYGFILLALMSCIRADLAPRASMRRFLAALTFKLAAESTLSVDNSSNL